MARARLSAAVIVAIFMLSCGVASAASAVRSVSPAMLEEIAAKATTSMGSEPTPISSSEAGFDSTSWVIRFSLGWEEDHQGRKDFEAAAQEVPPSIVQFGSYVVDSAESLALVDMLMIQKFPVVFSYGGRSARPDAPKGHNQVARVCGFQDEYPGSLTDMKEFKKFIHNIIPNRYAHPVSNALLPTVTRVSTMRQLIAVPTLAGTVSAPTIVFFGRLSDENIDQLSFLHTQGAALRGRVNLVVSSDSPLSREYKAMVQSEDKGFQAVILRRVSAASPAELVQEGEPIVGLTTIEAIGAVIRSAMSEGALEKYTQENNLKLAQWARDMRSYVGDSPLRKIDTYEQFQDDIVSVKHAITVLFVLRESDKHFGLHHQIAADVATFSRELQHKNLINGEPFVPKHSIRTDVFWLDAEIHKELARALSIANVPGVCFIMELQNNLKGVKFFPDVKGKELPDAEPLKKYIQSERLIDTKGIQQLDLSKVKFSANTGGSRLAFNNRYLGLDLRNYDGNLADPNPQQQQQQQGEDEAPKGPKPAVHLVREVLKQAELDAIEAAKPENKRKKLSPEQEAKKAAKEEAKKEALRVEMEKKNKAMEARMAAKKAKDAEIAAKIAAKKAAEPKKKKVKKAKKKKTVRKDKPPRDPAADTRAWEKEAVKMTKQFVKTDENGKMSIHNSLVAPKTAAEDKKDEL